MAVSKNTQLDTVRRVRKDTRRIAILVLGMHRSGTSALTRVLSLLGCDLPKTLMPATANNEAGHWESDAIYKLNDRILESAGSAWNDWQEFNPDWFDSARADEFRDQAVGTLAEEYGSSRLFVLKDPRNCRLLPFWLDVIERCDVRPLALLPIRNPLEASASLEKRDGFDPSLGNLLWLRHVLEAEAASRDIPRLFSTYDQLMQGWSRLVKDAREKLDIAWPRLSDRSAAEIDAFLSDELRHHRRSPESVIDNPGLSDWLRETFAIFEKWAQSGEVLEERHTLDRIRRDFNAASPAFSRLIAAGESARQKAARLERSLSEETSKLGAVEAQAAAAEQKAGQLQQELAAAQARVAESEKKISQVQDELVKRSAALQAADAARAEIQEKHGVTEAAVSEQREKASALEKDLAAQRQQAVDATGRVAELQDELEKHAAALREMEAARAEAESHSAEVGLSAAAERERAEQLEKDLNALRAAVEDAGRELAALRAELAEQAEDAAAAESATAELRDSLSQTQSALAQRSLEAEETAAALAAAREELRRAAALQGESEKVAAGFREHVTLLMADLKERQATYTALENANRDQIDRMETLLRRAADAEAHAATLEDELRRQGGERDSELVRLRHDLDDATNQRAEAEKIAAGLREHVTLLVSNIEKLRAEAGQKLESPRQDTELAMLRQDLAKAKADVNALKNETEKLRTEKVAAGGKAADDQAALEQRLKSRFDEIAALTRMVSQTERNVKSKEDVIDQMRLALAKEMGRTISALLDGSAWRFVPGRIRVRRQMVLLKRSGLFDAEWYASHYQDIVQTGVDPLLHYVVHGALEGREPNRTLAEFKKTAERG